MSEIIEFEGQQWESAEERPPLKNEIYLCRQCTERGPHPLRNMGDGYKSAEIILRPVSAPPQPPATIEKRLQSVCAKLSGEELLRKMLWRVPILTLDHDGEAEVLRRLKAYITLLDGLRSIAETLDKMAPCPEEILNQLLAEAQSLVKANE